MTDLELKPRLRFKGFTEAWEQREVNEIANRYDNLRVPVVSSQRVEGTTPYYGANGIQDYVDGYTHEGEFVLVAEDGANDLKNYPVQYVNGRIWVNNHAHVLQSNQNNDTKFLKYLISSTNIENLLVGGGRAKLNAEVLMKIDLTLPKKQEQIKISTLFDSLDFLITLHQRKLKIFCSHRFFKPVLFCYSWEQRKLGEIVDVYDGVHQTPDYKSSGIMFLSVENISTLQSQKYISKEAFEKDYKVYPQKGDILMTRIGDVGTPNVVKSGNLVAFYVSLALLKPKNIESYYLCYEIQSNFFQKGLKERTLVTAIPQKINKDEIDKIITFVPVNLNEQNKIGTLFDKLDSLITLHQRKQLFYIFNKVQIKISLLDQHLYFQVLVLYVSMFFQLYSYLNGLIFLQHLQ